jgi:hypothetical protein
MSFNQSRSSHKSVHDKSRGMFREASRQRYNLEKKDKEHEFSHHKEVIEKLLNERYEWIEDLHEGDHYLVRLHQNSSKDTVEVPFYYETNYTELKGIWQTEE